MKFSFTLILIVSAFLIGGASPNPRPSEGLTTKQHQEQIQTPVGKNREQDQVSTPAIYLSPKGNQPESAQGKKPASDQADDSKNKLTRYEFWSLIAQYLIIVGTVAYAVVALRQLYVLGSQVKVAANGVAVGAASAEAAQQSAHIAEHSLLIAERAWVRASFHQVYTLGDQSVDLEITNSGKSPGHIKQVQVVGFDATDKDKLAHYIPSPIPPDKLGTLWTIFPGENITQRWDVRLDPTEIQGIIEGSKRLTIYGFILYDDIFAQRHITHFYRVFMGITSQSQGRFMIPPDAEPGQNEAT